MNFISKFAIVKINWIKNQGIYPKILLAVNYIIVWFNLAPSF